MCAGGEILDYLTKKIILKLRRRRHYKVHGQKGRL